ncbi:MAG: hypothetical protein WDN50_20595 [Bradyrhizobium sp.]
MENETGAAASIRRFVKWAITPPQSYVVYLVALFLVAGGIVLCRDIETEKGGRIWSAACLGPAQLIFR